MINTDPSLNFNEKVMFRLRSLYRGRGYTQYKMSKFEEYDLYAKNKDFLISDSVITFTDTNGKLMALKPDVTLSIIKNLQDRPCDLQKVYYSENVYRISKGSHAFREIMQVGLECLGDIDDYQLSEAISLAAESLRAVCENCVLDISHLGLISDVMQTCSVPSWAEADILRCIGEKNSHELLAVCNEAGVNPEKAELLRLLATASGEPETVLSTLHTALDGMVDTAALDQLERITAALSEEVRGLCRLDFSVVGDTNYYNGIVFKGFIQGVPSAVLSGGQYDKLMQKMKRQSGAVGFAVYLDMLERLEQTPNAYDIDTVLLYDENDSPEKVNRVLRTLCETQVLVAKKVPENMQYRTLLRVSECEVDGR